MPRPSVPSLILFGSSANPASEIGQFGSYQSPIFSNALATIMSGTAFPRGWFASVLDDNRQFIQDQNAVDFLLCSYLFYIMTLGLAEYNANTIYWLNCITQIGGQIYLSLADNNQGNAPATSPTQWQPGLPGAEVSGVIKAYVGAVPPVGYLICDGSAVSRTLYPSLFNVCSTQFGPGDGSTTFNLPDLRTRIPVGLLNGDPNFGAIGNTGGEVTHQLTVAELASHSHYIAGNGAQPGEPGNQVGDFSGVSSAPAGGDQPHNNLQPFLTINYIIKT